MHLKLVNSISIRFSIQVNDPQCIWISVTPSHTNLQQLIQEQQQQNIPKLIFPHFLPLYTERSTQISLTSNCKRRYVENAITAYSTLRCFIRNFDIKQSRKCKQKYSYYNLGCLSFHTVNKIKTAFFGLILVNTIKNGQTVRKLNGRSNIDINC